MNNLCAVENVTVRFGDVVALDNVSLEVREGEIVGLFGHNGAGKSTVLKVLLGTVVPDSGSITLSCSLGYVPQGERVFKNLTVEENICLTSVEKKVPQYLLELFPALASKLRAKGKTLSGGEQQMVALLRALIHKPKLLLLDEPSLGLSPKLVREVFRLIECLRNTLGVGILVVEHNRDALAPLLNRSYVLENGMTIK